MKRVQAAILMFCLCLATAYHPLAAETENDLVAYWNFDSIAEESGAKYIRDLSGNQIDLKLDTTDYQQVDGFRGKAIDINLSLNTTEVPLTNQDNNAAYMTHTTDLLNQQLNGAEQITLMGYIKKKHMSQPATNTSLPAIKYMPGNAFGALIMLPQKNQLALQMRSAAGDAISGLTAANVYYGTQGFNDRKTGWAQFAFVIDYKSKIAKTYVDGVLVATSPTLSNFKQSVFTAPQSTSNFNLGSRYDLLDEVKIYKRGLSEEEIRTAMPAAIEYDFEDACNGTLNDLTGNQINGTVGTATVADGVSGKTVQITEPIQLPISGFMSALYGAKHVAVSFWLKQPQTDLAPTTILQAYSTQPNAALDIKLHSRGSIGFGARSQNTDSYSGLSVEHGIPLEDDSWHHFVMTIDYGQKSGKIYVDGRLLKEGTMAGFTTDHFLCGIALPADAKPDQDFIGNANVLMDSVKVFRRSLSDAEIQELAEELPPVDVTFKAEGTALTAEVAASNQTTAERATQTVILAKYTKDGKTLVGVDIETVNALGANGGRDAVTLLLDGKDSVENYSFKVFIWDKFETLSPVEEPILYP